MSKKKDTDYLAISARIRVLENKLLTRERLEQMVEAREDAEAVKLMADCGYPEVSPLTPGGLEAALAGAQTRLYADLAGALGEDNHLLPIFQIKYDYHNAKVLLKSEAVGVEADRLLVSGGRYDPHALADAYRQGTLETLTTPELAKAVEEARDLLASSKDPQLADFLLDRACYGEIAREAKGSQSAYLQKYVSLSVDALNLRSAVRARRAGRGTDFLSKALLEGGDVPPQAILNAQGEGFTRLYRDTPLAEAAQLGAALLAGSGDMTAFERACDNAVIRHMTAAHRVPFGPEPVAGYLFARESERTALRIVLSGRMAGLDKDTIRERLREVYA